MAFGLSSTGFAIKRLADIMDSLREKARDAFGANVNLEADGAAGILLGLMGGALDPVWQALQGLYDAFNPMNAEDILLDNLADLKGLTRHPATHSTAPITCTGTPGTVIAIGKLVESTNGYQWQVITSAITIGGGGTGTGAVQCTEAGAISAAIGTIDSIVTPVAGWSAVESTAAATEGDNAELNAELRDRMDSAGQVLGAGTVDSIYAQLTEMEEVTDCAVYENDTGSVDSEGRPEHCIHAVIYPDTVDPGDIAELLWTYKVGGIQTHGTQTESALDTQGRSHDLNWDWADDVNIICEVTLEYSDDYPADGDDQVEAVVLAYIVGLAMGWYVLRYGCVLSISDIPGIMTASAKLSIKPAAVADQDIEIDYNELATVETPATDITVVSTAY